MICRFTNTFLGATTDCRWDVCLVPVNLSLSPRVTVMSRLWPANACDVTHCNGWLTLFHDYAGKMRSVESSKRPVYRKRMQNCLLSLSWFLLYIRYRTFYESVGLCLSEINSSFGYVIGELWELTQLYCSPGSCGVMQLVEGNSGTWGNTWLDRR